MGHIGVSSRINGVICWKWSQSSVSESCQYSEILIVWLAISYPPAQLNRKWPGGAFISRSTELRPLHWTFQQMLTGFQPQHVCHLMWSWDIREGNTNMALTRDLAHNGTPPAIKIWWTVSNVLLRRAKCNHSARCSDAGSPVVFYCTYLVCVRSGNPTKWLCCITAWDTRPNHKHGHMTAWK